MFECNSTLERRLLSRLVKIFQAPDYKWLLGFGKESFFSAPAGSQAQHSRYLLSVDFARGV
jgi:hypothetical protein